MRRFQRHYVRQRDAALRRQGLDPAKRTPKGTRIEPSGRRRRTQARIVRLHAGITDADAIARTIEQDPEQERACRSTGPWWVIRMLVGSFQPEGANVTRCVISVMTPVQESTEPGSGLGLE